MTLHQEISNEEAHYHFALQQFVELVEIYGIQQIQEDLIKYKLNDVPNNVALGINFIEGAQND